MGVVSLACLAVLLVTGVVLMWFYDPSGKTVPYSGSYEPLNGVQVSEAYASTMHISFDVRGGLLLRQAHHWAALLLPASVMLQMLGVFFNGTFRRPRHLSWLLLAVTFLLALGAGWSGYALPDDLLAGTGLRIVEGILVGIPVVGTWATLVLFGGEFPGIAIERMYWLHVAVIPAGLVGVLLLRLRLAARRQPAGSSATHVVGLPLSAVAVRAAGLFAIVAGVLALLGGVVTVNPIWTHGPASGAHASAGSQPDWYTAFLDGALRLVPSGWEASVLGRALPYGLLLAQAAVGLFITVIVLWPWLESRVTGDRRDHHVLQRPRDHAVRTGFGVAGLTFFAVLWSAGATDIVTARLGIPFEHQVWALRAGLVVGPPTAFLIARAICNGLVDRERLAAEQGSETGVILRSAVGGYTEVHSPTPPSSLPARRAS